MKGEEGWVRVHSDEDESRSEEAMITYNILMGFVEKLLDAPSSTDSESQNAAVEWWDAHPEIEQRVREVADSIAAEFDLNSMMERDFSRNREPTPDPPDVSILNKIMSLPVGPTPLGGEITLQEDIDD